MGFATAAIIGASVLGGVVASKAAGKAAKTQEWAAGTAAEAQVSAAEIGAEAQLEGLKMSTEATERATRESIAFQQRLFDQSRADTAPWREAGENALFKLMGGTRYKGTRPNPRDFMRSPPLTQGEITTQETERQDQSIEEIKNNYLNLFGREVDPANLKRWEKSGLKGQALTDAIKNEAKTFGKTYEIEGAEYENPFFIEGESENLKWSW
jgi:hypothetical protein